ncbi:acyloxyacyl hydrolase [Alkalilimnicola sp. S0819]|uniref:acyloxyacyl hydrolase n=1 Tax=Alkalilimnicola sp. S0819 TaxID=2613922 RepID=UPI00128C5D23|nr:acyloxyacyl hydrolase [Alkalilimnicola sp. S0819]
MKRLAVCLCLLLGSAAASGAGLELGLRGGQGGANLDSGTVTRQEVFLRRPLARRYGLGGRWQARPYWALTAGTLKADGDHSAALGVGGGARFAPQGASLGLDLGLSAFWLEEYELDSFELGGHWQFTSHLGVYWQPHPRWGLTYRVQHTSNAGLYRRNEGLNMQTLELWYRWP